jgi:hypothetical protein
MIPSLQLTFLIVSVAVLAFIISAIAIFRLNGDVPTLAGVLAN